ncbi:methylthioadenosine/S-adenosylhomocysteine MTA/SAH nucleosidase [Nitzschia inconspicua]|uniref:Methylthioadenosine/S-adenosylhomocysteine MTA/SAH nucleosidase n=1 Tax=Nitzschia inconspicua TaxID=303405 RepID=A0A9K3K512_9STRA|nr:methylthioadenosine/S-adenosylhomocysteine MTA/SAH nucleosidase [Nitzschia inconspicua]
MNAAETMIFGGRKFYRGTIHGANVVATLTGVSIENAAASTALMLQLYPGVERLTGGGIAGGVDPSLQIGDVVIPDQWAMYQMQIYGKDLGNGIYEPVDFEQDIIVGKNCGGWDGVSRYLLETQRFWFSVDETMLEAAKKVANTVTLLNSTDDFELDYTPKIVVGGNGVSGPTFVDNVRYREYVFEEFEAQCLDMETAATAHIAFQHDVPFLFFRSLSDLAGADQDGNVMGVFFSIAATNAFTVMSAFIEELYPHLVSNETEQPEAPTAETADSSKLKPSQALFLVAVLLATSFLI